MIRPKPLPKEDFEETLNEQRAKIQKLREQRKSVPPIEKHKGHNLLLIKEPSGPHPGKWVCSDCNNVYVRWATKDETK